MIIIFFGLIKLSNTNAPVLEVLTKPSLHSLHICYENKHWWLIKSYTEQSQFRMVYLDTTVLHHKLVVFVLCPIVAAKYFFLHFESRCPRDQHLCFFFSFFINDYKLMYQFIKFEGFCNYCIYMNLKYLLDKGMLVLPVTISNVS